MKQILCFALFLFLASCAKDVPALPFNAVNGNAPFPIEIDSVQFFSSTALTKDMRIEYTLPVLLELNSAQMEQVTGYIMYKNGAERSEWGLDRTWFYDSSLNRGSEYCYEIALRTTEGPSKRSEVFCHLIP